jgi:hypothetical protein
MKTDGQRGPLAIVLTFGVCVVVLGGVSTAEGSGRAILALPNDGVTPVSAEEVHARVGQIRIEVRERPLRDLLQKIQNITLIRFELPTRLMDLPITMTITAPDWPTAIDRLLRGLNRAEVWDGAKQLRQVVVLGGGAAPQPPPLQGADVRIKAGRTPLPPSEPSPDHPGPPSLDPGTVNAPPGVVRATTVKAGPPRRETAIIETGPPPDWSQPFEPGPQAMPGETAGRGSGPPQ